MVNDEKIKKAGDDKEVSIGRKIVAGIVLVFLVLLVIGIINNIIRLVQGEGFWIGILGSSMIFLILILGLYGVFCTLLKR